MKNIFLTDKTELEIRLFKDNPDQGGKECNYKGYKRVVTQRTKEFWKATNDIKHCKCCGHEEITMKLTNNTVLTFDKIKEDLLYQDYPKYIRIFLNNNLMYWFILGNLFLETGNTKGTTPKFKKGFLTITED